MKRKLITAVRKSFRTALAHAFPDFNPSCEPVGPHCDLYVHQPRPGLRWYLMLEPDLFEDCFHIEAASTPYEALPPCHSPSLPDSPAADDDLRFRITALWAPRDPYAAWWLGHPLGDATSPAIVPSEDEGHVIRAVPHQVADCIEQIRTHVLPYLSKTLSNDPGKKDTLAAAVRKHSEEPARHKAAGSHLRSTNTNVLPFSALKKLQTCLEARERESQEE